MSEPLTFRDNVLYLAGLYPEAKFTPTWMDYFGLLFRDIDQSILRSAIQTVKLQQRGFTPEISAIREAVDLLTPRPEGISLNRNIERIRALWPSAGLGSDWYDLFRKQFGNCNHEWVATAIEQVKCSYGSHVPEMKWFLAAFDEVRKEESAKRRGDARTPEEKAAKAERDRITEDYEVEEGRRLDRELIAGSDDETVGAAFARFEGTWFRGVAKHRSKPLEDWTHLARGMIAAAIRERRNIPAPTFGTGPQV